MSDWRQMLRDHDPGAERMDAEATARIRTTVVRVARTTPAPDAAWPMRVALAGFAVVVLALAVGGTPRPGAIAPEPADPVAGTERRQIQFSTPGGTRIIWELNPNFTLRETLP